MTGSNETRPFADWIGRRTETEDIVTKRLAASFRAVFEPHLAAVPTGTAPLGIHWCLSPAIAPMAALGPDGHPAKNRDLPPVPQPRRMWAGGTIETLDLLRVGDRVTRLSTIGDATTKRGRSGELWFVTVQHEYLTRRGPAIRERHDIVYREAAKPGGSPPPSTTAEGRKAARVWSVVTSPVLLFRYSALTFNGHRIHYDLPYATEVEGYDGLVVHGPIQATLLYNLAADVFGQVPRHFDYRGLSAAVAGSPLVVCQENSGLGWTQTGTGKVHMESRAYSHMRSEVEQHRSGF